VNIKIKQILGGLLLCFMFFGTYLDARTTQEIGGRSRSRGPVVRVARRGHGGRGSYRGHMGHRSYRGYRRDGWYGYPYGLLGPSLWFTIASTRSSRPKKDPLKTEKEQAETAIRSYDKTLDELDRSIDNLQLVVAKLPSSDYEITRSIIDYDHQMNILNLKLDLLANRIDAAEKSKKRMLLDVVSITQSQQANLAAMRATIDQLTREASTETLKNAHDTIEYHAKQIKRFSEEIQRLINKL